MVVSGRRQAILKGSAPFYFGHTIMILRYVSKHIDATNAWR
jgi:hypothetical protein